MAFKVKDLLITVLPAEGEAGARVGMCPDRSLNLTWSTGHSRCCCCTRCSVTYTQGRSCYCQIANPEDLAILKQQLKDALLDVETMERNIQEAMRPKTLSEVEELEEKLTSALSEIKTQKAKLQKTVPGKTRPKPRGGRP